MPEISILVPVYNTEKYLKRCMDSIINQTFSDIEIICMDDGSTDTSGDLLDQYAQQDSRVRVFHKENGGYGNTMNQAISLACGKYIGIVESDDYIRPEMYEKLYGLMQRYPLDFVKSDFWRLWDREDGSEQIAYRKLTEEQNIYNRVLDPNEEWNSYYIEKFTWNALYRKDFLLENQIRYNETAGASYQDNGFWFQTFYFAKKVMFLDEAFYCYKQDNPNSSVNSNKKTYAMKVEYDYIRDFLVAQKDVPHKLFEICFHFRLDGYLFTLSMLANRYKLELANIIKQECAYYEQLGEADYSKFPEYKKEIIQQVKRSPEKYVGGQIEENLQVSSKLDQYSHIIIYGAGSYGIRTYNHIKGKLEQEVLIDFAVTALNGKKQYYFSNVVKEITEFIEERNHCIVVIAVKEESDAYIEISHLLKQLGFTNVMNCKELLS